MSGLLLSSTQADTPFYIEEISKNIYSIEELSFYLYNHLYLVDEEFFSEELMEYIDKDLNNSMIANGLRQAVEHKAALHEMVSFVIKASGYYNADEIHAFQKQLDMLKASSVTDRLKAKADILMTNKKYSMAMEIYNKIVTRPGSESGQTFYGDVYNNIGVIYANIFDYETAKKYFSKAYKINHSMATLRHLIYADILSDGDIAKTADRFNASKDMIEKCKRDIEEIESDTSHPYTDDTEVNKCLEKIITQYEIQFSHQAD